MRPENIDSADAAPVELLHHEGKKYLKLDLNLLSPSRDYATADGGGAWGDGYSYHTEYGARVNAAKTAPKDIEKQYEHYSYARLIPFNAAIKIERKLKYFDAGSIIITDLRRPKYSQNTPKPHATHIMSKEDFLANYGDHIINHRKYFDAHVPTNGKGKEWIEHELENNRNASITTKFDPALFTFCPFQESHKITLQTTGHVITDNIVFKEPALQQAFIKAIDDNAVPHTNIKRMALGRGGSVSDFGVEM